MNWKTKAAFRGPGCSGQTQAVRGRAAGRPPTPHSSPWEGGQEATTPGQHRVCRGPSLPGCGFCNFTTSRLWGTQPQPPTESRLCSSAGHFTALRLSLRICEMGMMTAFPSQDCPEDTTRPCKPLCLLPGRRARTAYVSPKFVRRSPC